MKENALLSKVFRPKTAAWRLVEPSRLDRVVWLESVYNSDYKVSRAQIRFILILPYKLGKTLRFEIHLRSNVKSSSIVMTNKIPKF